MISRKKMFIKGSSEAKKGEYIIGYKTIPPLCFNIERAERNKTILRAVLAKEPACGVVRRG